MFSLAKAKILSFLNKKPNFLLLALFCLGFFILDINIIYAADNWIPTEIQTIPLVILGMIFYLPVYVLGKAISVLVAILIYLASYNEFGEESIVNTGWIIMRDLCNMLFIVILLVVALASILRIESYHYRNWLPKLILMAVLINFSKAIGLFLIDMMQVVMLTFANGVSRIGGGNFIKLLGIHKYLSFSPWGGGDLGSPFELGSDINQQLENGGGWLGIAGSILMALIFTVITVGVILAIVVILAARIVALWVLLIVSPFAYLFAASPFGRQYSGKWWGEFTKWLTRGPILVFFLWLSLKTLGEFNIFSESKISEAEISLVDSKVDQNFIGLYAGSTAITTFRSMGGYIIAIITLLASLSIAQSVGGAAGRAAATVYGGAIKGQRRLSDWVNRKQATGLFRDVPVLKRLPVLGTGTGMDFSARTLKKIGAGFEAQKGRDILQIEEKASSNLRIGGATGLLTGFSATDYHDEYIGLVKAPVKAVSGNLVIERMNRNKLKKAEKELKKMEDEQNKLISHADYISESSRIKEEIAEAEAEEQRANVIYNSSLSNSDEKEKAKDEAEKAQLKVDSLKRQREVLQERAEKTQEIFDKDFDKIDSADFSAKKDEIKTGIYKNEEIIRNKRKYFAKYKPIAQAGRRASRTLESEMRKNMPEDTQNLIAAYQNYFHDGNAPGAKVALRKLFEKADANDLIQGTLKFSYDYEGINKFFDELAKKLSMNEHEKLSFQAEMSEIAKANKDQNAGGMVRLGSDGSFIRNDFLTQKAIMLNNNNKGNIEGLYRGSFGRHPLFSENEKGESKITAVGLEIVKGSYKVLEKEIERGRLDRRIAQELYNNVESLKKLSETLAGTHKEGFDNMINELEGFAKEVGVNSEEEQIRAIEQSGALDQKTKQS